jgi:general stress protein 26
MEPQLRKKIQDILEHCNDMTIATLRPDGWPQATTVSYVSEGLSIYFGTGAHSQKATNLATCDRVSLTVNRPYGDWDAILGLSLAGHARRMTDEKEVARVGRLMFDKFPQIAKYAPLDMGELVLFEVTPTVVSVLDYSQSFGHTDLVTLA